MNAHDVAERQVAAWYLAHRHGDPRTSLLRPEHFRHPGLRDAWTSAQRREPGWNLWDLGIPTALASELAEASTLSRRELADAERRIVSDWGRRRLLEAVGSVLDDVKAGRVETLERAIGDVRRACGEAEAGCLSRSITHAESGLAVIQEWRDANRKGAAVPMPLRWLQEKTGGWMRGKVWFIEGITSGHKTTLARMAAWHAVKAGHTALFWTMEDRHVDMSPRTFSAEIHEIDTRTFAGDDRLGVDQSDAERLFRKLGQHLDSDNSRRLRYLDDGMPALSTVTGKVSAEVASGVDFVVLDFFQLVQPDDRRTPETRHWYDVANGLANLAKQLDVPILCTAQPNNDAQREQEQTGRPLTRSDIRGGAAINQAAWGILVINSVGDTNPQTKRWERNTRKIQITIAKNKRGESSVGRLFGVIPEHDTITEETPYA